MVFRKPMYLNYVGIHTNLKIRCCSWHLKNPIIWALLTFIQTLEICGILVVRHITLLVLKRILISFHNNFNLSFSNLLAPSTKNPNIKGYFYFIVLPSVKWHTQEKKTKKDEAKFKNALKLMHFQVLPHLFSFVPSLPYVFFITPHVCWNMRLPPFLFHTLHKTLMNEQF